MCFVRGIPLRNNSFLIENTFLEDDLNMSAFNFLAVCNINLTYLYRCLFILDQKDAVFDLSSLGRHVSTFVNCKGCVGRDLIAFRCYCLTKCVGYSGFEAFDLVGFLAGYPLLNNISVFEDLDCRTLDFLAVCNVGLAHLNLGLGVLNQKYSILDLCGLG